MGSWFDEEIVEPGKLPLFACFTAFIVTFVATRTITRLIRSGRGPFKDNVSDSGVHVHHAVPGLLILTVGSFLAVGVGTRQPWATIAGVLVGIGTSLVLDEFALILHLQDVYWSEEGRVSVELAGFAVACMGLVLLGVVPFGDDFAAGKPAQLASALVAIAFHLTTVGLSAMKGKYRTALFGFFIPTIAIVGAVRLARPASRWARRRYAPAKRVRAQARAERFDDRWFPVARWLSNTVAGKPTAAAPEAPAPETTMR